LAKLDWFMDPYLDSNRLGDFSMQMTPLRLISWYFIHENNAKNLIEGSFNIFQD